MSRVFDITRRNGKKYKPKKSTKIFFACLQIIISLDFGYMRFRSRRLNYVIKALTFLQTFIFSGVSFIYLLESIQEAFVFTWIITLIIQYFFNSFLLLLFGLENSYYALQKTLMAVDAKLSVDTETYDLEKKIVGIGTFCIVLKGTIYPIFCYDNAECPASLFGMILSSIQLMSYDMILLMFSFIFYSVLCRLKVIIELIRDSDQVLLGLEMYKTIADAILKPKKYIDFLYLLSLIIKTIDLVFTTYLGLFKAKEYSMLELTHHQVIRYLYTIYNLTLMCLPALCAGAVASAAHRLHLLLHDRLLKERNSPQEDNILMFTEYTAARPLQFTIFHIIPMDYKLPVAILNLCITYQIVIVQFTKLY